MFEKVLDNLYWWFCESPTIDKLESWLVNNRFETLSKLGMKFFGIEWEIKFKGENDMEFKFEDFKTKKIAIHCNTKEKAIIF
ncbi:hypothetical protein [Clostridium botulinum]|uniref:hypothetical protein n=1 Tax=Clostridium botulinum TaxID=1491 RepID=UPI00178CA9C1|nr:hypothetical protein [Clostridium botulinum]MBY6799521.1 hypothetical protein [Clostridium botulinum]